MSSNSTPTRVQASGADAKSPDKLPGANGFKYRPQYGLIVACKDEAEQQRRYARLQRLGYAPKVVCV